MSASILDVKKLRKTFPGVVALDDVSFGLIPGEVHALCGENGAGKSTLIKCISGVYPASSYDGEILLDGHPIAFTGTHDAENAGIAVIHQELALVREMTVAENIFLGCEPVSGWTIDWNQVYSRASELLKEYNLDIDPSVRVGDLGIGKQQMVEIAKALSKNSRILLLDEPTAALTETEVDVLLNIVRQLKNRGITCVYISHKLDEIFNISDRITVLRDGLAVATLPTAQTDKSEVIRYMVGREITDFYPRRKTEIGDVILSVKDLSVKDDIEQKMVVENISFEARAGEVLGIGGLIGAGRTELIKHIFGAFGQRIGGIVTLNGSVLENNTPSDSISRGLTLVSEDRKRSGLIPEETVGFNLSLSSLAKYIRSGMIDANQEMSVNQEFMDSLRIKAPGQGTPINTLSGGNQQKVVLGKALMTEPNVIFLDEPTRGIDVGAKLEVYELINELTSQNKAVVLISSELPELMGMSDRIMILSAGRIGGTFEAGQATQESIMRAAMAYSGLTQSEER
ncbi:MAG: sugar ABC transporter ATP-binding protein [Armatimonadota bacterium]